MTSYRRTLTCPECGTTFGYVDDQRKWMKHKCMSCSAWLEDPEERPCPSSEAIKAERRAKKRAKKRAKSWGGG